MSANGHKISVLIPTCNRAKYLSQAINSVLSQDYGNFEVIVSDNASTDETEEIASDFRHDSRFKYYRNSVNIGMVPNWRKALSYATGDWFLLLSDDDYLIDKTYLSQVFQLIQKHPDVGVVYANGYIDFSSTGERVELKLPFSEYVSGKDVFISRGTVLPQDYTLCNIVFNKVLAFKCESFRDDYNIATDTELFLKICLHANVGIINKFVSVYRLHGANLILTFRKDSRLLLSHLDSYVCPYNDALKLSFFSDVELNSWRRRNILGVFAVLYKAALIYHPGNAFSIVRKLVARNNITISEFLWVNLCLIKRLLRKCFFNLIL